MSEDKKEVQTTIRIPRDLYEQLQSLAAVEYRSIHNQILYILKEALMNKRIRIYFTSEGES